MINDKEKNKFHKSNVNFLNVNSSKFKINFMNDNSFNLNINFVNVILDNFLFMITQKNILSIKLELLMKLSLVNHCKNLICKLIIVSFRIYLLMN